MLDRLSRLAQRSIAAVNAWLDRWRWTRITRAALLGFMAHEGPEHAGSMAYFAVLSVVNLLVLGVVLASIVVGEGTARRFVVDWVTSGAPVDPKLVTDLIDGAVAARGSVTVVGIVLLVWGALGVFNALSRGVAKVFADTAPPRPFWRNPIVSLILLATAGALATGSVVIGIATDLLARLAEPVSGVETSGLLLFAVSLVVPLVTVFAAFFVIYRVVPSRRLTASEIWPGALVATALWTVFRIGFTAYTTRIAHYDSVFGPIAAGISLLVFLYFASVITLLGAEVARAAALEDERNTTAFE